MKTLALALAGALALVAGPAAASCSLAQLAGTWQLQNASGSCVVAIRSTGVVLSDECSPGTATIVASTCAVEINLGTLEFAGRAENVASLLNRRPNHLIGELTDTELEEVGFAVGHRLSNVQLLPVGAGASAKKHRGLN